MGAFPATASTTIWATLGFIAVCERAESLQTLLPTATHAALPTTPIVATFAAVTINRAITGLVLGTVGVWKLHTFAAGAAATVITTLLAIAIR